MLRWLKESLPYLERWLEENEIEQGAVRRVLDGVHASAAGERPFGDPRADTTVFIPGLETAAWWDDDRFDWMPKLEAATAEILAEFELVGGPTGVRTVVETTGRADEGRWSAYYLHYMGKPYPKNIKNCPRTMAALEDVPGAVECGMCYFSILDPRTHVVPHSGFTNAHLRVHLGLVVPDYCRMRVGDMIRGWDRGKAVVFDDSYEHEVWNDGAAPRAVLLFDIWHPDLTRPERTLLLHMINVWRKLYRRRSLIKDLLR